MFCGKCGTALAEGASFCGSCGTPIAGDFKPVTSLRRLANYFLDYVIGMVVLIVLFIVLGDKMAWWYSYVFYAFYYVGLEYLFQRTPAKYLTKTKVVDRNGERPSFGRILGRNAARLIPFEPFSFLVTPVGWHDSLSKTYVVPADYTEEQVKQIHPGAYKSSGGSRVVLVVVGLLVGIAVLGLLASIVLLSLNSARAKSRDAKRVNDVRQIQQGIDQYFDANGEYPDSLELLVPNYIETIPDAPTPPDGSCRIEDSEYYYDKLAVDDYELEFCLGAAMAGYNEGVNTISPQ